MTRTSRPPTARLPRGIAGKVKGWLTLNGDFLLGPRYIQLLEGIDRTGTIREGCKATKMSYRTCLNRLRQMERALGTPVIIATRGGKTRGRTALTPEGRQLVHLYRTWRELVEHSSQEAFSRSLRSTS